MKKKILFFLCAALYCCTQLSAQTLDKKFASTNGSVNATLVSGDTVYIGGSFTQIGYGVKGLARFKPGTTKPEAGFPELGNYTEARVIEPDNSGGFYLGGDFSNYNGVPITQTSVIHILSDGTLDKNFGTVDANYGNIYALKKKGNRLYVGGDFYYLQGKPRQNLAALNATTGVLDNWIPDAPNSSVNKIDASDSLIFINGSFDRVGNVYLQSRFAALKIKDGKLITNFPGCDSYVTAFKVDNNTLYIGGPFNNLGYYKQGIGKANAGTANLNLEFPSTDGTVWCVLPDNKGGYYIGGSFSTVGNLSRGNLAHILANGTVDLAFYVNVNNTIYSMAADSTNLYIGGNFTNVNGAVRNRVASIVKSTGALTTFNPDANNTVNTIAIYGNTVYIGGWFTTVTGKQRNYAAAITTKNDLTAWAPNPNNFVNKIVLNNSGTSAFLGGTFTTIKKNSIPYLAKVNTIDGKPFSWKPNPNNYVNNMLLNDNILYVKGSFYTINGVSRQCFAAIDTISNTPTSLTADINSYDYSYGSGYNDLSINNGKLYIAGNFSSIQNSERINIARIDLATGLVDKWNANGSVKPNSPVLSVCADRNSVIFGGSFNFLSMATRNHLAAIDLADSSFTVKDWQPHVLSFNYGHITDIMHYKNNLYACGSFQYDTSTNGSYSWGTMYNIIALNDSTGKISHQFTQYPNAVINSLCLFNNHLVVSGWFNAINNISNSSFADPRYYLASYSLSDYKLLPERYDPNNYTNIAADKFGNLITAGDFTLMNYINRPYLASIDINTGLPTSWNPAPTGQVYALAIKDSSLFVGGNYYSIGINHEYYPNLNAVNIKTGQVIKNWSAITNDVVYTLSVKDEILYAGGAFTSIKNTARNFAAALSVNNGTLKAWNPNPNGIVRTILPLNNAVYLGGNFTTVKGNARQYLAKVNNTNGGVSSWNPDPDGIPYSIISSGKTVFVGGSFQQIASKTRKALAAFDSSTNTLTSFDAKINNYGSTQIFPLVAYGKNLYFGNVDYSQTIGDSIRGPLAGVDIATKVAISFDPTPDYGYYNNLSNSLAVGKNKLFAGGNWISLRENVSPSHFAVFTLEPQAKATNLNFTDLQSTSVTAKFKAGGGENRLVVIQQGSIPSAPADGKGYIANPVFGSGDSTASASYIVYNGNGSSVNISNLLPGQSYTVSVYEYNGSGSASDYLTYAVLTGTFTTPNQLAKPVIPVNGEEAITAKASSTAKVYPNPAKSECTVSFRAEDNQEYTIDFADATGKILMHRIINSTKGINILNLKIGNLANGTYFVNVINESGERQNLKLIKQ